MPSDEESGTSVIVSEFETQFIPRSGDEEVLWAVQEITAERGKKYKVKWVGADPATGKSWPQSWVAKHDCTNDLVVEWKGKKKRLAEQKKRGGRTSTASRASGSSKRTGPSTSGKKTRPSTSEATTSRLGSVQEHSSSPPKRPATKRKRQSETPATTSSGVAQADEHSEVPRPRKKQKTTLEILLPPISSSDEEGSALPAPDSRPKGTLRKKASLKSTGAPSDRSESDYSSPPKAKDKPVRRSDVGSKGAAISSRASDLQGESRRRDSKMKMKTKATPRRKERVADTDAESTASSQEEEALRPKSKKKSLPKRMSLSEKSDGLSEKAVVSPATPMRIGPPRGAKRQKEVRGSLSPSDPGLPCTKPLEDDSADGHDPIEESNDHPGDDASIFGNPLLLQQDTVDTPTSALPLPPISIPQAVLSTPPRSPDLSPGATARLELFDRMMANASEPDAAPPADAREHMPDDTHINDNDIHDTFDAFDAFDPPQLLSPPTSKSKPKPSKPGTPNVVPETESSGPSQAQSQLESGLPPSAQPPPVPESPRRPMDLPAIAVVIASAASSSVSPQDLYALPPKYPSSVKRPSKRPAVKPVPHISPNTFRLKINAHSHGADSEAPPSSIESFASPKRVDKGKQRAVEEDQLQSSLSEGEGDGERRKKPAQKKMTDSTLKKGGKELFDQVQRARRAERKKKKAATRLKSVREIVNRPASPSKGSPLPFTGDAENGLEMQWDDVIDLTGGANSTTLDTAEQSEAKPLSEEERQRLRIELRQEEEENTQEAMGVSPSIPTNDPEPVNGRDAQMPPPRSPEHSAFNGQLEDADRVEQPSTDLQLDSVLVQPSQEQRHEDTDIEPSPVNGLASSPARRIPENLTDSPKRRLGEALSLLNVKSEEIQRLERALADERRDLQRLKADLAEAKQSSEPTGPVLAAWEAERAQWAQERAKWENDCTMWETQRKEWSDDKATLSTRVTELLNAATRVEEISTQLSELEAERVAWTKERDAMQNDLTRRSEELDQLSKVNGENVEARSKWEAEKASWIEEKAGWETERATLQEQQEASSRTIEELTTSVESLMSAKVSVEKDRDFFREQYMQASGFVSSVRDENAELEKRVEVAEGQAQEGVAVIKAFYEGRVKALQADLGRWKGLTELLQEKDRRTNDELRLRAAQAPELADLCSRVTAEKKSLEVDFRKLAQIQQRSIVQRNKLYREVFLLKKEKASLKSKLAKLAKMADRSTQDTSHSAPVPPLLQDPDSLDPNDMEPVPPLLQDPDSLDPNDMEMLPDPTPPLSDASVEEPALFPCMWRPHWRDQCQHVFDTKEDLERHMQAHLWDLTHA